MWASVGGGYGCVDWVSRDIVVVVVVWESIGLDWGEFEVVVVEGGGCGRWMMMLREPTPSY